jgi:NAD(P)-dependent dehydrogenase (short-subunit alcohol dehydrogenase family)
MNYGFDGKVALVTGASGGIGRATALGFAASGAAVVVSDVNDAGGEETAAMIVAAGGTALYQRCNVADSGEVKALVARAVSAYGRLDYAHNNAGINNLGANEYDDAVWDRAVAINLSGVMYCMREEAEAMLTNGGGAIVNTSSINGLVGNGARALLESRHGQSKPRLDLGRRCAGPAAATFAVCLSSNAVRLWLAALSFSRRRTLSSWVLLPKWVFMVCSSFENVVALHALQRSVWGPSRSCGAWPRVAT